jgi:hypothetical protein
MRYHEAMPSECYHKRRHDTAFCPADCPAVPGGPLFERIRVVAAEAIPPPSARVVDVAVLDMNHGWLNVGHDALIAAVQEVVCDLADPLSDAGLQVRVLTYDVRQRCVVPQPGDRRFSLYLGTGGPGHLDPRLNRGDDPNAQGIAEDASWESPLFALFDEIGARGDAALLGVCHTFGLMCRWLDVARPVARGPEKGGKSEGVRENILTEEALGHPLFAAFARHLKDGRRLRILDSRIYDLIPQEREDRQITPVGMETLGVGGPAGNAMTMMEVARDPGGVMPRIFGVNHHPEIIDRTRLLAMLRDKLERGEVERDWYDLRVRDLESRFTDRESDVALRTTSEFTFLGPMRFHLTRALRLRAEGLGGTFAAHESDVERGLIGAPTLS